MSSDAPLASPVMDLDDALAITDPLERLKQIQGRVLPDLENEQKRQRNVLRDAIALAAAQVWATGDLSLADIAKAAGVSKAYAQQWVEAGRKLAAFKGTKINRTKRGRPIPPGLGPDD